MNILVIEDDTRRLEPFCRALKSAGYTPQRVADELPEKVALSQIDLLVLDIETARRPVSSQYIRAPRILVLTPHQHDTLPPWLRAGHARLVRYPTRPGDLVDRLPELLAPETSLAAEQTVSPQHLPLLFEIARTLGAHLDLEALIDQALAIAPRLGGTFAALLLVDADETIYYRSTQPGRDDLQGPSARRFARRLLEEGLEGWVIRQRQVVSLPNTLVDSRWFRASYIPEAGGSVVAVPLNLDRVNARGVYLVGHTETHHFAADTLPLLTAAARQVEQAVSNALLFKSQTERSVQLALINEVSQAATSILSLDVMLTTVVQAIRRTLAFYRVSIYLYNPSARRLELKAEAAAPGNLPHVPRPASGYSLGEGDVGRTAVSRRTLLVNDTAAQPPEPDNPPNVRSVLCVPVTLGVKLVGVLKLQSARLEAFQPYHVAALEMMADQLAIAIENARLYEEINRRADELKTLNEIGQAINSTLDLQETLTLVTRHTTRLMDAAAASLALRDDERGEIVFAAAYGEASEAVIGLRLPLGQGIAGWVARHGQPILAPDVSADPRFYAEVDRQSGFATRAILCVPLQSKGRTIGAIEVMNKRRGMFTPDDQALLQALAVSAATAIENAQLYRQAENLRLFNEDIIRHMTNGLIAVNRAGTVTACNPAASRMLNRPQDEILHRPIEQVFAGTPALQQVFRQTLAEGRPAVVRELTLHRGDGTSLPVSVSVAPMEAGQDGQKASGGVVGVLEDLSDIKALEAERRRLDRLAALGEMAAVVAHEIRNPVAAIGAGVEYLTRSVGPGSPEYEGVQMVKNEIKRVNRIIEDILFMARPLSLNLSREDLTAIIAGVLQRFRPVLDSQGIAVQFDPPPDLPPLKVDRQRMEQVFGNLVANAIQAMPDGGRLTIQTEPVPADQGVTVTILDTGPGIPPEARPRIFEPFFTTRTKGTGLGLPVARRIVEEHGGTIRVESGTNQGARFVIHLPGERKPAE